MNGLRFHCHSSGNNPLHVQIAFVGRSRADTDRLIRQKRVERIPVSLRIHGHCLDPHFPAGPDNPHRDLSPVGNQYFRKHKPFPYPIIKVNSAATATLPSTVAVAFPMPIGPFCLMISHSSRSLSPGTTFLLNLA